MSQAGIISASANPAVATSYTTNNGTAVPTGNVLQVQAIDTTENNANGITVEGGLAEAGAVNRVQVQLTNRLQGAVSVTGAITGDIVTFALGASAAVYRFEFFVAGRDTATDDGVGYSVQGSAKTDGAAATLVQTAMVDADEDTSLLTADMDMVVSGNNVILQALGVAGQTVSYSAVGTYVVI